MDENRKTMNWLRLVATPHDQAAIAEETCQVSQRDDVQGQRWTVRANDGSFEMILSQNRTIETIFLFPDHNADLPLGLLAHFEQADVHGLLGEAARSSPEKVSPLFGPMAAWDRYDIDLCRVHIEYRLDEPGLKLVTLMTLESES